MKNNNFGREVQKELYLFHISKTTFCRCFVDSEYFCSFYKHFNIEIFEVS